MPESTRAVMSGTSVVARHDFLPFGEEIGAGTGLRTTLQGFGATDRIRQRYAMTERDDTTGLDHTWWRKYESLAGRWTSPDPYLGSMSVANPQSFNRFAYVNNDPINLVDPSSLCLRIEYYIGDYIAVSWTLCNFDLPFFTPEEAPEPPIGGGQTVEPKKQTANECRKKALEELAAELKSRQEIFPGDSFKLATLLLGAASGARTGATVGSVVVPGAGTATGALVGTSVGVTAAAFLSDLQEARVERGPVQRFMEKDKQCSKLAKQEAKERKQSGLAFEAAGPPQMFVITRQFGTFALYSYTIRQGPTLLGDFIYTTFGPNPTDRVTRRVGR